MTTPAPNFWTVVETADHADPILAVFRTEAEAQVWERAYDADPRFHGDPEVRPGWFASAYGEWRS